MRASSTGYPRTVLAVAVLAISSAAVLVRLMPEVHPVGAAFWRTFVVALLLAPTFLRSDFRSSGISRRNALLTLLAGALLAVHFTAWFASLHRTTVLRSTLLVCLAPVWTGLMEWGLHGLRPSGRFWGGVSLALVGLVVMATGSPPSGEAAWIGDALALGGGMLSAAYLLVGRVVRQDVEIGPYGSLVCAACASWLLVVALIDGVPLSGFSNTAWLALGAMALGPQLLGHIGLNYAVRYLPAAIVASVTLLEPAGATALGAVVLGEVPSTPEALGSALAVAGVFVSMRPGSPRADPDPQEQ